MKIILTILYFVLSSNKDNWGSIQASVMCVSSCLILTKLTSKWQLSVFCILLKMSNYPASQGCSLDNQFWERSTFRYGNKETEIVEKMEITSFLVLCEVKPQDGRLLMEIASSMLFMALCDVKPQDGRLQHIDYHNLVLTT